MLIASPAVNSSAENQTQSEDDNRISRGFEIAPVPLNLNGKDRKLVGLGSYLVNAASGCTDCHTNPNYAPGHNPFMGQPKQINPKYYLGGGVHFGPFISRNLTPEDNDLPAGRTYDQFAQQMHTGIDLDHKHPQFGPLLQVMPWPLYQDMTDHDLKAIYEYLRAIPHAEAGVSKLQPSSTTWTFSAHPIGEMSGPGVIYLSENGNLPVNFTSIAITGLSANDFKITSNTCGAVVQPFKTCQVSFFFKPTNIGLRQAQLVVSSDDPNSPLSITLAGVGN